MRKNSFFTENDFLDFSIQDRFPHYFQYNDKLNNSYCEMSRFESAFLCGLIKKYQPKYILEVGLAAGATTVMMLEAIDKYNLQSKLYSIDLNDNYYRDTTKESCFLARERENE